MQSKEKQETLESSQHERYQEENKPNQTLNTDDPHEQKDDALAESDGGLDSQVPRANQGEATPVQHGLSVPRQIILGCLMTWTTILINGTGSSSLQVIPRMAADLGITELEAQWISSACTLASGCGLLVSGRLADIYGRKRIYILGMLIHLVFSVISGVLRSTAALCAMRALAGLGHSLVFPAAFGIIGVHFPVEPVRTMAFAALSLGCPIGSGALPIATGAIAGIGPRTWQYTFFFLAGLTVVPMAIGVLVIPPCPPQVTVERRIDWLGGCLITGGLALLLFVIVQGGIEIDGWRRPYIPILFVVSIIIIGIFALWQHHLDSRTSFPPLIRPRVFSRHHWKVTWVLVISFMAMISIGGWLYLTTIWFQTIKGDSVLMNAVHVLPAPMVGIAANALVPILGPRVRAPFLLMAGTILTSIACVLFAVAPIDMTYWGCAFLSNLFNPFGSDFVVGIGYILISNLVDRDDQSTAGALFQTSLQVASTLGVCLCSLVHTVVERQTGDLVKGVRDAWWMLAGFSWLSTALTALTLWRVRLAKDVANIP